MDELQKLLEAALGELEAFAKLTTDAEAIEDEKEKEAKIKEVKDAYDAKNVEVNELEERLELAIQQSKVDAKRQRLLAEAGSLSKLVVPAGASGLGTSAEAIDHVKEQREYEEMFFKYLSRGDKFLSANELTAIRPKSMKFDEGKEGAVLPRTMISSFMGSKWIEQMFGRAIPMDSATNSEGGFLVPQDFRPTVLQLPSEQIHLLPRATVVPSPTGQVTIPRLQQSDAGGEFGGVLPAWTSEGGSKPETEAVFEQVNIFTHELSLYTEVTQRLLNRSAIALEPFLNNLFRGVLMDTLDNAGINGTGTGQPFGILNTAGIRTIARQGANAVNYQDLVNLKYLIKPYHRANAIYIVGDDVMQGLEGTLDADGRPLFSASTANGPFDRLLGKPFIVTDRQPTIGTAGDIIFGDLREYYFAMEDEVVIRRSEHFKFRNNVVALAAFMVVGGLAVQPRVFAVLSATS